VLESFQKSVKKSVSGFFVNHELASKLDLQLKWLWIWTLAALFCISGMTSLAYFLNIWVVFWYGIVLILIYLIYMPFLARKKNLERSNFIFLLSIILATFVAMILLGGIVSSMGLIFVGLTCAFSSVLLNNARLTIILFIIFSFTIIITALLQPYLTVPEYVTPSSNLLFYVLNILWMTSTTLIFILFYIKQQSGIEEAEAKKLKELDEAKTRIYTNITHEFRTPLTIILGMADLIEKKQEAGIQEGVREIKQKGNSLLHLINQMLDLSKLEAGILKNDLINNDIITYLKYLTESFNSYAESKQILLTFSTPLPELYMDYDPEKLMHIISNLLSNAIKYTDSGGKVLVYAELGKDSDHKETFVIQVKDTGIGIKRDNIPYIFDRFFREDDERISTKIGTGLGLALTKELVNLLNGNISLNSIPGEGTTFFILFPITSTISLKKDVDVSSLKELVTPYIDNSRDFLIPDEVDDRNMEGKPVLLIVEDNNDVIQYLCEILKDKYQVEIAFNGKEGLDKAIKTIPDIVISDIMMPVMNGYELLDQLKNDIRTSHIPVVLLTAKADFSSKMEGFKKGADAYLLKPFSQEELFVRLEKLIESRKKIQEHFAQYYPSKGIMKNYSLPMEEIFMLKVGEILETHIENEEFGIAALCREIPMSRAQLYRKFKALTNTTVSKYIRSIRLNKAKDLLISTNLTVSEVAFQVGFKNLSHFSSNFTEEFGVNPSKLPR